MKKLALVSLIAAAVFFLTACAQHPFEEYENFVNDLDISARIEDAIYTANQGNTSDFFINEVQTIYEDLDAFEQASSIAHEINSDYSASVQSILHSIDLRKTGDAHQAKTQLDQAMNSFSSAQNLYAQFLAQYNQINRSNQQ